MLGSLAGGVLVALGLFLLSGLAASASDHQKLMVATAAALIVVARDYGGLKLWLPSASRQVPVEIFRRRLGIASFQFGLEMGTGCRTFMTGTLPYFAAVVIVLVGAPVDALVIGTAFGLARGLVPFGRLSSSLSTRWDETLAEWSLGRRFERATAPAAIVLVTIQASFLLQGEAVFG